MTDSVDALVFDIDGTICEYERTTADLLPLAFERAGVDQFFTATEYISRYEEFLESSESVLDHREHCFVDIAREKGRDPELAREVAAAYAAERDHTRVRFLDGARKTLDALDGSYPLAAVTNGDPEMQSQKLDSLGVDCFETVVHAGYDAPAKPSPEPFEMALSTIETPPERALYVGNSLGADVAGAHNTGMTAAWLADGTDEPEPVPEYSLDSPRDVLDILE